MRATRLRFSSRDTREGELKAAQVFNLAFAAGKSTTPQLEASGLWIDMDQVILGLMERSPGDS